MVSFTVEIKRGRSFVEKFSHFSDVDGMNVKGFHMRVAWVYVEIKWGLT